MPEATTSAKSAMGGSMLEVLAGIVAVILAIVGLAGVARYGMAGAATIVVGVALVLEAGAVLARMRAAERQGAERGPAQMGGAAAVEILGGITGIVLGGVALLDFAPLITIPSAIIVYGGALMMASAGTARVHVHAPGAEGAPAGRAASSFELLIGIAALTLGVLALIGFAPLLLSLIALLAIGATVLLSGTAISARMGRLVARGKRYRDRRHVGAEHRHPTV